jgi:hypothetical protein
MAKSFWSNDIHYMMSHVSGIQDLLFNRPMPDEERHRIAKELGDQLGVTEPAPQSFEGVPIFHHENPCVFGSLTERL